MIKAYIDFWKRAFDFSGRSTRPDFWWAYLVNVIIITILTVFCVLIPFFSNVDLSDSGITPPPSRTSRPAAVWNTVVRLSGIVVSSVLPISRKKIR